MEFYPIQYNMIADKIPILCLDELQVFVHLSRCNHELFRTNHSCGHCNKNAVTYTHFWHTAEMNICNDSNKRWKYAFSSMLWFAEYTK